MKITYFVHCTTTDNETGRATGWNPGVLAPIAAEQAAQLLNQVKDPSFDIVITSDLSRAVESAKLMFGERFHQLADARLREANYGDWNGGPHHFKASLQDFIEQPFPNGESYHDVELRMRDFLQELRKQPHHHIAIVAHEAPQLALDVILNGKSWQEAINENWRKTGAWQPGWIYTLHQP